ncbi:hypothetical protein KJ815_12410, partial [bacterium]|nr:hypothetical protein [bacterium]
RAAYFGIAFIVAFGVPFFLLMNASHGWFGLYTVTIPAAHPWDKLMLLSFWTQDILLPLPIAFTLVFFYLILRWRERRRDDWLFVLLVGAGMIAAAYAPRVKAGNFDNDLVPAYAFLALVFGAALADLRERIRRSESSQRSTAGLLHALLMLLVVVQFASLVYHPSRMIPSAKDRQAGMELVRQVRAYPGPVWVVHHGYISVMAGKAPLVTMQPMQDLLAATDERSREMIVASVEDVLRRHSFDAIFLNEPWPEQLRGVECYEAKRAVFADTSCFWPVTGYRTRPELVYEPIRTTCGSQQNQEIE